MFSKGTLRLAFFVISLLTLTLTNAAASNYDKDLWLKWEKNNPVSTTTINHKPWQTFIDHYVTKPHEGLSLIDYRHISDKSKKTLKLYLKYLSRIKISQYNRDEQLAFWINLYNALTVNTVLEHYPIKSIRDINISPGLFTVGPWQAKVIEIEGAPLSLKDIKNRIIRPIWNDARTLYALSNASLGAPNLPPYAFTGKNIDKELNQAASTYINSLRGAQVIQGKLSVSKIYDWYIDDFGGTQQSIIEHLKVFAHPSFKMKLAKIHNIDTYVYNWHLNETHTNAK